MSAKLLNGRELAQQVNRKTATLIKKNNLTPTLVSIFDVTNVGSKLYVGMKHKKANELGIHTIEVDLDNNSSTKDVVQLVQEFNEKNEVSGILIQLPLPKQIDQQQVIRAIDPNKDVDGLTIFNLGKLYGKFDQQQDTLVAATPKGVMTLLQNNEIDVASKNAVVIGRSNLFGRPMAALLLNANATVTIVHRFTPEKELNNYLSDADIVIVAVGKENFLSKQKLKKNAVVIDVGANKNAQGKTVGDVDFDAVSERVGFITPVPGGVGPMTIATLLQNTANAASEKING